ncbi:DNA-binding transcriptional regulator, LysR family [Sphingopyxis flava]|uniref:DNA-binding transcriptional regulator, LysR family n=2 Tax=Sphingopyxis flava TaxID=1507287 RepID=A0A1T5DUM3_9SPHN|nr:DNA-binding transcriptional regulator, LysR family [Sphingopyxis flava]
MARSRMDWSDLQFILAVADRGSLGAAARTLGVNHTTVLRRIQAFEKAHGVRLFDRLPSGHALTGAGEAAQDIARSIAELVEELEGRIAGEDLRLEGTLRIATTDTLMASILPGILAAFQKEHPAVEMDVSVGSDLANLGKREADVAIRVTAAPQETLIGRKIGVVAMAVYRTAADEAPLAQMPALLSEKWVALSGDLAGTSVGRWMRANVGEGQIACRIDNFISLAQAAAAGMGLAALPVYLGDYAPGLRRASAPIHLRPIPSLWILSHRDLKRSAKVRAFVNFGAAALLRERKRLAG